MHIMYAKQFFFVKNVKLKRKGNAFYCTIWKRKIILYDTIYIPLTSIESYRRPF